LIRTKTDTSYFGDVITWSLIDLWAAIPWVQPDMDSNLPIFTDREIPMSMSESSQIYITNTGT